MSDEQNALVINADNIPAHLLARAKAKQRNAEALNGLSTGGVARIGVKNGRFRIKEPGSDEVAIPAKELVEGTHLPVVITGIRGPLNKVYYAKPYDPNQDENVAPDCFSLDGVAPDPTVENPINSNCAGCPMNAFGTGKNQAGQPTKGKACADNKVIAVYYRDKVYAMKIPPASLKNLATYIRELDRHELDYASVVTFISLDDSADYSVLEFRVGKYLSEEQCAKVDTLCDAHETQEIMNPKPFVKQIEHDEQKALPEKEEKKPAKESAKKSAKKPAAKAKPEPEPEEEPASDEGVDEPALPSDAAIDDLLGL